MPRVRIHELVERLTRTGWKAGPAASVEEVDWAELELGVSFPSDYREFLLAVGGRSSLEPWRGLFRIDELVSLNQSMPVFQSFQGMIGVGNEGFVVYALDYSRRVPPLLVSFGLSSSDWSDVQVEADHFAEWLERTLPPG
ncbi:MAG: SMI1/KNR4 family protein [Planctomycetes bacterium]|nr:SMI1/KNR4 family protein [Planctomycetota bacterium]